MTREVEIYQGRGFNAELIRTDRKRTATVVVENGKPSVVIPKHLSTENIQKLVNGKTKWIKEKIYLQSQYSPVKTKEYVNGECFSYFGKNYRLKIQTAKSKSVKLRNGRLTVALPKEERTSQNIQLALIEWYQELAETRLKEKTKRYASVIGVSPRSVRVKSFKSRWGSCHTNGDITYNWKIILSPNSIVDYVVVHELCHLKHYNHSPRFWKSVEKIIPDWMERKEWLKINGRSLEI